MSKVAHVSAVTFFIVSAVTAPRRCLARVAMALSTLSGDEQGIMLGQLRNALEPRLVMYFSSASNLLASDASLAHTITV